MKGVWISKSRIQSFYNALEAHKNVINDYVHIFGSCRIYITDESTFYGRKKAGDLLHFIHL